MRKKLLALTMLVAALALPAAAFSSSSESASARSPAAAKDSVRLVVLTSGLATVLAGIADNVNAYQRQGLDVQVTGVKSGDSNLAVQELVQGKYDAAFVNAESVAALDYAYVSKGQPAPLKAVAATTNVSNLVLSSKIHYTGPNSLKGLTLGVSSLSSIHKTNFDYWLGTKGTSESALGIKMVPLSSSIMPSALASGQIDGFLHSEPTTTIAIDNAHAQLAVSLGGAVHQEAANVLAVSTTFINSHRATVQKLVNAFRYATAQFQSMPESRIVNVYTGYTNEPADLITQVIHQKDHYYPGLVWLRAAAESYWGLGIEALKAANVVTDALKENDMFDFSFDTVKLTVKTAGKGTVRSAVVGGGKCGSVCKLGADQPVKLTAHPARGAAFARWRGACKGTKPVCKLIPGSTATVTAVFRRKK